VIANVARYHRGSPPKKKHRTYSGLDKDLRDRILRLSRSFASPTDSTADT